MNEHLDHLERDWAALGVRFNCAPADRSPDLERLLLETARRAPDNARLLPLVSTWLARYDGFVARHRLKRLAAQELEPTHQPALGLLLESAVGLGASRDLLIAAEACRPAEKPRPLYRVQSGSAALRGIAERTASPVSRRWGVWAPDVVPKPDAVRPVSWLLRQNPDYRDRIVRKGDLRSSVLEALRRDTPDGHVESVAALARLAGATRAAVQKAVDSLALEGVVEVAARPAERRDQPVALRTAA